MVKKLPPLILVVGLLAALAGFYISWKQDRANQLVEMQQTALQAFSTIEGRIGKYATIVSSGRALNAARNNNLSRESWREFFEALQVETQYPGLYGLSFISFTPERNRASLLQALVAEHGAGSTIRPPGVRSYHCVIQYAEPAHSNSGVIGLDICTSTVTRNLLFQARDSGQMVVTARNENWQEGSPVTFYLPVYRTDARTDSVDARRAALIGWVAAPVLVNDMMNGVLGPSVALDLQMFDGPSAQPSLLLYDRPGDMSPPRLDYSGRAVEENVFQVANRQWMLVFSRPYSLSYTPLIVAAAMIALAVMLAFVAFRMSRERVKIEKRAEELSADARAKEEFIRSLSENISEGVFRMSSQFDLLFANPSLALLFGYKTPDFMKRAESPIRAYDGNVWNVLITRLRKTGGFKDEELEFVRQDGTTFIGLMSCEAFRSGKGQPQYFDGAIRDITDRKEQEREIAHKAYYDQLTGLCNRTSMGLHLKQAMDHSLRSKAQFAVLFIDLDRFKIINDTLGHHMGDALLKGVAQRLEASVRKDDIVCRQGGDEFVVILPHVRTAEDAAKVAQKIIESVGQPYEIDDEEMGEHHTLHTSPSIGIAVYPDNGNDIDTLTKNADVAMYKAKANGRNNFVFFNANMNESANEKLQLETALHGATDRGEFSIKYELQVSLQTGNVIGLHALPYWRHPEKGELAPEQFLPIAEPTATMITIGDWMLKTVSQHISHWADQGFPLVPVTVSVAPIHLKRGNILESVKAAVNSAQIDPRHLIIEFSESPLIVDASDVLSMIQKTREFGAQFVLDRFGLRGNTFDALQRYPLARVNIPAELVRQTPASEQASVIVTHLLNVTHALGIQAVAKGCDTHETGKFLKEGGCTAAQGNRFMGAVEVGKIDALLTKLATRVAATEAETEA